jgi:hypothetical protein
VPSLRVVGLGPVVSHARVWVREVVLAERLAEQKLRVTVSTSW